MDYQTEHVRVTRSYHGGGESSLMPKKLAYNNNINNINNKRYAVQKQYQQQQQLSNRLHKPQRGPDLEFDINNPIEITTDINAATARKEAVKVEAHAPSGRVMEMGVGEANGCYTANFTPTEVGDWAISIFYENVHIQGSPFQVRVYDAAQVKVFGLHGGAVGQTFSFSADCTSAGTGELTVEIKHDGALIPSTLTPVGPGVNQISFVPPTSGMYNIKVFFAGVEIGGSPYTLDIVDSNLVRAQGEGLSKIQAGRRAAFNVNTHGSHGGDIRVNITGPNGVTVPCNVTPGPDGTFRVEYNPTDVGEYRIDVTYYGKPITGSPFRAHCSDWNMIRVQNLSRFGNVGKTVEFQIDASAAGSGNLEIMVNDGTIPCSVQNRGNRLFHASFIPKEAIDHLIQMRFNGMEVKESPWRVEVKGASHVTSSGAGLNMVSARSQTSFEIRTGSMEGTLQATVFTPSQRRLPVQVINQYNGNYSVEYTPNEVGIHTIDVRYNNVAIPGSPFSAKVYEPSAIIISPVGHGVIGKPVEFTIDVNQAGEGQLEIMVNRGSVPNTVKMLRKGVFLVTFIPQNNRDHDINVKFNGEELPCCPVKVPILDASRVTVHGEGIRQVAVNRSSYFRVNTQSAGEADLNVRVTAPSGRNVPANLIGSPSTGYDVDYSPPEVGTHRIDLDIAGQPIPGSPFYAKSFDPTKVKVEGITDGVVSRRSTFTVDVSGAGEGNLEISVGGNKRNIKNEVSQLASERFEVAYTPLEGVPHKATVCFNDQHVPGSPFPFNVLDASAVSCTGEGLGIVASGKPTSFLINAPGAAAPDLEVTIKGPGEEPVPSNLTQKNADNFLVTYTPFLNGDHTVDVKYLGLIITGSPFKPRAWDSSLVKVFNLKPGRSGRPCNFNIDASAAGAGNLEIIVSIAGENVPNFVNSQGKGRFEVSFTPQVPDTHMVSVKFNNEPVPGSPFYCALVHGENAIGRGEGLERCHRLKQGEFWVDTAELGDAELLVTMISPSGKVVETEQTGNPDNGYHVTYTPDEVGAHNLKVEYADIDIKESPFFPDVYEVNLIHVGEIPDGVINKPIVFEVDAGMAGRGELSAKVQGRTTYPPATVTNRENSIFDVSFVPTEPVPHLIVLYFNEDMVPNSPFTARVCTLENIKLDWEQARGVPIGQPCFGMLNPTGSPKSLVEATVEDPYGRPCESNISMQGDLYRIEFTPDHVGTYTMNVMYAGQLIPRNPFICTTYDAQKVKVVDVSPSGMVGQELSFTVDTSEAGSGDIDVEVTCQGQLVRTTRHPLDNRHHLFTYVPLVGVEHLIDVTFNYEKLQNLPLHIPVTDPSTKFMLGSSAAPRLSVGQDGWSMVNLHGVEIDKSKLTHVVTAPNGELVPAKMVAQPDGDYKVEYSSKYTGRHTVEILYAGSAIMGSPFFVEIYDPNKIRVEGVTNGIVGQNISFDILRHEAGKAELGLTIRSPSGRDVRYQTVPIPQGDRISYLPQEPGAYLIYITYGGLEVPGCPLTQKITDDAAVTVYGDGLLRGEEGKASSFFVKCDSPNAHGDLWVQVDGPNSIAKCNIEAREPGRYEVTYVPVENGIYTIVIKWNNKTLVGCPYHPRIGRSSDSSRVGMIQSSGVPSTDANGALILKVNQVKRLEFDATHAGPGTPSAQLTGPHGTVACDVHQLGDRKFVVTFTPTHAGEYRLHVLYDGANVAMSPFVGIAQTGMGSAINHEKVVLTGKGLKEARVREEAEFVVDGRSAGAGVPHVTLKGVKANVDVTTLPFGNNMYRCVYKPTIPGAYLLDIMWSDRQVQGSPFKVNVTSASDASRVVCTGEGLKMGVMGQEIKSVIDTRRAGPGELTAHCQGPRKEAYCSLTNNHDGTFTLTIKPQEAGKHTLTIKYDEEHVPGSPFTLRVSGAPDASKVRVNGPGIEHGLLALYQSRFIVETRGAGAGQLTVRIRGPKGAFRVEMQRESSKDRTILCRYDPTEVGEYLVHVKWSGEHVPGSPFHVHIADTQNELDQFGVDGNFPNSTRTMESRMHNMDF